MFTARLSASFFAIALIVEKTRGQHTRRICFLQRRGSNGLPGRARCRPTICRIPGIRAASVRFAGPRCRMLPASWLSCPPAVSTPRSPLPPMREFSLAAGRAGIENSLACPNSIRFLRERWSIIPGQFHHGPQDPSRMGVDDEGHGRGARQVKREDASCAHGAAPRGSRTCPLCGGLNACAPAMAGTFAVSCWCQTARISRDVLARVPADQVDKSCLCPRCAAGGFPVDSAPAT